MKFSSANYLKVSFLLLLSIGFTQNLKASHSMGSDLTYQCLGGNSYEITLSFYRDCAGVEADTQATITFESSCYPAFDVDIFQIAGTGQEISPACPNNPTTCNGGVLTGIQEYIYKGIVNLPGPCIDWQFSYNLCCRNNAITNINNPGQTLMYVYATLNNTITPCNNSPIFSNKPVPFVCVGQQFCYNHGAYDQDGDSLVYSLMTPLDSPGNPVNYSSPWSATNPLSSSPALTLDPQTGDICMTPTSLEITVMAVLVEEYRNGILIGSVERDIQITVISCNNIVPTLTGIDGTNSFSQTICAGSQSCFTVYSGDADAVQNTFVDWDYSIAGATFTIFPGQRETASFCWTPTSAQISSNPYCFTVTVRDDNCPYVGSQTYAFCITVTGVNVNAGPDITVGCNATTPLTANANGGSGVYTYQWNTGENTQSINGGPGTYTVTTSDGICSSSDTTLVIPTAGTPLAAFSTNFNCTSLNVQFTDQSTITGGTISTYAWNFGDGTTSLLQSPAHSYSGLGNFSVQLIITSAGGCVDTLTQTLHLSLNVPDAEFNLLNGCIGTQVNFTDLSTSPSTITTWSWDFGDGTASTVTSPAHIYSVSGGYNATLVIVNIDGCMDSIFHPLTIYDLPIASAGINDTICSGATAHLTATGGTSYLWNPGSLTTAAIAINPTTSTTYLVTVTDFHGCQSTDAASVVIPQQPNVTVQNRTICPGDNTNLTANVQGGGFPGNYFFLWNPGGLTTQQINVNPAVTTDYFVTVTNSYGCSTIDTATVTVNPAVIANAGLNQQICPGDSATLSASGGNNYQWSPGFGNSQQITVAPNILTTYTVVVTSQAGCTATDLVDVLVFGSPIAFAGLDQIVCAGSIVTLNATGGFTFLWTPGNINTQQINVAVLNNTTYDVLVTDANGCTATDQVDVSVNNLPAANAGSDQAICLGNTTTLNANGGINYNWSPGNDTLQQLIIGPTSNTTYTLTATDANGCQDTDQVFVRVNTLPDIAMSSTNTICYGQINGTASALGSGSTPPYSYSWSPIVGTNSSITGLAPGKYYVTVVDANNCIQNDSVLVGEPDSIYLVMDSSAALCFGSANGHATVLTFGGVPSFTYHWLPYGGDSAIATGLLSGNYTVTTTDANGCNNASSVFIGQPDSIELTTSFLPVLCNGASTGSASVIAIGGTMTYSYQWSPNGGTSTNATNLSAGNYSVTVTDNNGCVSIANTTITQSTPINLFVSTVPTICIGQSADLVANINGGTAPYSVQWNTSETTLAIQVSPVITTTYTITVSDSNNCTINPVSVIVPVYPPLGVSAVNTPPICYGLTTQLDATGSGGNGGPYSYHWNDSTIFGATPIVAPVNDSIFTVTVSDGCSPPVSQSITLTVYPLPEVDFTPHLISGCTPVEVSFQNYFVPEAGSEYFWNLDDNTYSNDTNPIHTYIIPGNYDVTLTIVTPEGCAETKIVNNAITVFGFPIADFFQSADQATLFYPVIAFTDNSVDAIDWQWNFGDGDTISGINQPTHEYPDSGNYTIRLIVISNGGCTDTTYGYIRIEPEFTLYVPNAFTPNGDGINDGFFATGIGFVSYEMLIMDRWGKQIFYSQEKEKQWDGSFFGGDKSCQNDVYEYIINVKDYKGKAHKVIGHVSLVR